MDFETKQKAGMNKINKCLNVEKSELATLSKILLKRKKIQIKKPIKMLEKERKSLSNKQSYNFEIELEQWMQLNYVVWHGKITVLILAALILPSTTKVERLFSLMKIIWTKLQKWLTNKNLSTPMRIWEINYKEIMELWLKAKETLAKKRHIDCRLHWHFYFFKYIFTFRFS